MKRVISKILCTMLITAVVFGSSISVKADEMTEISSIDIQFEVPSVGDEVTRDATTDIIQYYPFPNITVKEEGPWASGRYVISDNIYEDGTPMPDSNRFSGTFEKDKEYYIYINYYCESAGLYHKACKLSDSVKDNIMINGEKPVSIGDVIFASETIGKVYEIEFVYKFTPKTNSESKTIPEGPEGTMYRLYNSNSGEHFYTGDINEANNLYNIGWDYETYAWTSPTSSEIPVYRLYNSFGGYHHYTTSVTERDNLVSLGWVDEGIAWYSYDDTGIPLYRVYNPNAKGEQEAGGHHYTKDISERNYLISIGWIDEGIGWYGV